MKPRSQVPVSNAADSPTAHMPVTSDRCTQLMPAGRGIPRGAGHTTQCSQPRPSGSPYPTALPAVTTRSVQQTLRQGHPSRRRHEALGAAVEHATSRIARTRRRSLPPPSSTERRAPDDEAPRQPDDVIRPPPCLPHGRGVDTWSTVRAIASSPQARSTAALATVVDAAILTTITATSLRLASGPELCTDAVPNRSGAKRRRGM